MWRVQIPLMPEGVEHNLMQKYKVPYYWFRYL